MAKCERCHGEFDSKELSIIGHYGMNKRIHLCDHCYRFIRELFDDVIDEYVLRKE